jgi:hypothetical protein
MNECNFINLQGKYSVIGEYVQKENLIKKVSLMSPHYILQHNMKFVLTNTN